MRNLGLYRLRPGPTILAAAIGLLWAFAFGAVRDFVWADLRKGMIRLDGLSRVTRGLVLLGFGLLLVMVGALLFNDVWRAQSPLLPLIRGIARRGTMLPAPLAPATLFLLSAAWTFALTGAHRSHWAIRLGTLALYLLSALGWTSQAGPPNLGPAAASWAGLAGVPLFFLLRRRAAARPAVDFAILLPLVGVTFVLLQARGVEGWRSSGIPLVLGSLSASVQGLAALAFPLLLRIGFNIADFTQRAAGWTVAIAEDRLPRWATPTMLLVLVAWRLREVVLEAGERVRGGSLEAELPALLGGLAVPLGVGLVWWLVVGRPAAGGRPPPSGDEVSAAAARHALPLIVAWLALNLAVFVLTEVARAAIGALGLDAVRAAYAQISAATTWLNSRPVNVGWRLLVAGLALVAAALLTRRGRSALALYLGIFGLLDLRSALTSPGGPLGRFSSVGPGNPVDFWWVALLALLATTWLLRGRLSPARVNRLLFVLLVTALLRQTDFISNPFSPFLGFAGVGFIAFGLVWDALTIGAWANATSPALPRVGRLFLYLGYVILTITVVNWAHTVHDLATLGYFTGEIGLGGLNVFGRPLLYAIFALTLALPPAGEERRR